MSNDERRDDPPTRRPSPQQHHQQHHQQEHQRHQQRRKTECAVWKYRALSVVDVLLHVFVVSTLGIGVWRASYQLFVVYYEDFNPWLATGFAVLVQLFLSIISDPLVKYFKKKNHSKIAFWVTSRAYIYARFIFGMIMFVYQEWLLELTLDHIHTHIKIPPNIVTSIAIGILCAVRMLATIMGPPTCGFEFDPKPEIIFQFERMFWPEHRRAGMPSSVRREPQSDAKAAAAAALSATASLRRELSDNSPPLLTAVDAALSTAVITPVVVTYWRITWKLMDLYVVPGHRAWSTVASVAIGFFGLFVFTLVQHRIKSYLRPRKHTAMYYVVSRGYTAAFALSCVNSWRGIWDAMDMLTGVRPPAIAASVALGIGCLASMKTLRNIIAPPIAILTDSYDGYFEVPTLFRIGVSRNGTGSWLYVLDSFFSVCIIGSLVVIVWRGVWNLMDQHLGPEDAVLSLVIGYSIVLTAFALQPVVKKLVNKVTGLKRIIVVDVYLLFSFVGAVNVWRGVWIMLDKYFIPDAPITSYWVSHIVCFGFLVLLNSSNSILVRGVYIDAEEDGTQCVDFPCYYVRLLVQKRKRRKQRRKEEEGKEMTQIKVGMEEKTEDPNEKILLVNENEDKNQREVEETLNNVGKIV